MASVFKTPKIAAPEAAAPIELPTPKKVRMPTMSDDVTRSAAERTRSAALKRRGRQSTIMTDQTKSITGSSGAKLGA